jgi:ATP-binding cassette subfamily B (MDR/TAP) protein 1
VYLAIAQFVAIYGATLGFIYLGESISRKIREQYLAALLRQELAFFDQHGAGEFTTRLTSDIDRIQNAIGEKFSLTVTAISTFVSAFIVGFVLCWQVMLSISWSVIVSIVAMMVGSRLSRKYRSQALDTSSRANSIVEESVTSIRDVVALAAQSRLLDCYERFLSEAESASRHLKVLLGCVLGITVGVNYLNIMIALWLGSFYLVKGDIPYTSVITIQLVITNAIFALMGVSGNVEAFLTARAAADKIFKMTDRVSSLDGTSTLGINLSHVNGVMELRGVSHAYSSRSDVKVLDAVSIIFPAGKTTALVGESGSGKSTVAALLERFYDPCEGTVLR